MDEANVAAHAGENLPDDRFVMTTWHARESLDEVFWFAKSAAKHPDVALRETVILDISAASRCDELVAKYEGAGAES